jgi:replicative DNA helicase
MSLDITTLRLLRTRERYEQFASAIPDRAVSAHTKALIKDFGRMFAESPELQRIEPEPFMLWLKIARPKLSEDALAIIAGVMRQVDSDPEPGVESAIMGRLYEAESAARIADILAAWNDGGEVNLQYMVQREAEQLALRQNRVVVNPQVLTPIEELLDEDANDTGLRFRLKCLDAHIKPLVPGDFVVLAARPDKGKTSLCADILTHMAAQVDTLYPGENRSILWFNNEGPGRRIVKRAFQAALGATVEEMVAMRALPPKDPKYGHRLREAYAEALGGRPGVLRVMDIHDMWNHEVEALIQRYRPALVLFDMIDNIKFGGSTLNGGERTDQLLESMYQWARMMGVKHNTAVMATSQVSAEGDGMQYPTLPMLKDSRTGKQGAADVIITMGAVNDPTLANSRYLGTTKNKKARTGVPASPRAEVYFDADRCRFKEFG